jgi:hypothetical protein
MKKIFTGLMTALLFSGAAWAQSSGARLKLNFDSLSSRASESVNVNLDRSMLRFAAAFLSDDDKDEAAARSLIAGLEGIYVRNFTFDREGAYSASDLEGVRSQLGGNWQRIVDVRSKDGENTEIYADTLNGHIGGMVILASEPTELTVVNIVGPIDLEKLSHLEGEFGIPKIDIKNK